MSKLTIPSLPTFKTTLPTSGKDVMYRPITVREESFLLQVKETSNEQEAIDMVLELVSNCVKGIDVRKLPLIDIEWLFIQIRMKSVSEEIELFYKCNKPTGNDKICGAQISTVVDLNKIELKGDQRIKTKIEFSSGVYGLSFKQPGLNVNSKMSEIEYLWALLEMIEDPSGEVITKEELTLDEFQEFIFTFTSPQIKQLKDAMSNIATIYYKNDIKCPSCGNETSIEYKSLMDFFH